MANEPGLQEGMSGEWVEYLQQMLPRAGCWPGDVDGQFGPDLSAAVQTFQSGLGMATDGLVGPQVWAELTGEANQCIPGLNVNEFPEILALAHSPDWDSYVHDVVGVDPRLFINDELVA